MKELKKILIVDDSDIDREMLKSFLAEEFTIIEADSGYAGFEAILKQAELDAIILDVTMPVLDGFSVLQLMKDRNIDIPVFMVTAEATKENIERAVQFNVAEFIKKPFDRDDVLTRLKSKLGVFDEVELEEEDIEETKKYIANLESVYEKYLNNFHDDSKHYARMAGLMKILLSRYTANSFEVNLARERIEIISKAAYFCDIGNMLVARGRGHKDDEEEGSMSSHHSLLGADIIKVNPSKRCAYFVHVCSEICINHHERYDGNGYPGRASGNNLSVYAQMCSLVDQFDTLFNKYREHNNLQFDFVASELAQDRGAVSKDIFQLLTDSKFNIVMFYSANNKG